MGKTLNTILVTACLGLVSGASFVAGRGYEREQQPIPQPPTVRFADEDILAEVYFSKEFTERHSQEDLDAAIGFAISNASGNLEFTGPTYHLVVEMDRLCVERKMDLLFGPEEMPQNGS